MGGFSSSSGNSSQTQMPVFPWQLNRMTNMSERDWTNMLKFAGPELLSLMENPSQIGEITPADLAQVTTPEEQQAEAEIKQLTGGPIGSAPTTQAGMQAYQDISAPMIAGEVAMTGGGRGGALPAAEMQGQEQAYVPLLEQEVQNRQWGAGEMANIGQVLAARQWQRYLPWLQLLEQVTMGPTEQFGPAQIGQALTGSTNTSGWSIV